MDIKFERWLTALNRLLEVNSDQLINLIDESTLLASAVIQTPDGETLVDARPLVRGLLRDAGLVNVADVEAALGLAPQSPEAEEKVQEDSDARTDRVLRLGSWARVAGTTVAGAFAAFDTQETSELTEEMQRFLAVRYVQVAQCTCAALLSLIVDSGQVILPEEVTTVGTTVTDPDLIDSIKSLLQDHGVDATSLDDDEEEESE